MTFLDRAHSWFFEFCRTHTIWIFQHRKQLGIQQQLGLMGLPVNRSLRLPGKSASALAPATCSTSTATSSGAPIRAPKAVFPKAGLFLAFGLLGGMF